MRSIRRLRLALVVALLGVTSCSKPGIDGGENGGQAFIAFAVTIVLMVIVLAIFLGRED